MGSTGCHLTCIMSAEATQRQIVLYYDVDTHQQPVCQEARYRKKLLLTIRAVMLQELVDLVAGTLTVLPGAAHAATIENSSVLSKKPSLIRTYRCHLAPHHWCAVFICNHAESNIDPSIFDTADHVPTNIPDEPQSTQL